MITFNRLHLQGKKISNEMASDSFLIQYGFCAVYIGILYKGI